MLLLDFRAKYEETSTTALSANPAVVVPLLTITGWIMMQRKVTYGSGSVLFGQNWAAYRDGFGSATVNDNYWLGLDKVYRLMQLGNVRLRVEVTDNNSIIHSKILPAFNYQCMPLKRSDLLIHLICKVAGHKSYSFIYM